jgi:WD40 repeat protein
MSAAEEQRKRLEALRKKKEEVRLKQQGIANKYNDVTGGSEQTTGGSHGTGFDPSQTETSKAAVSKKSGPSIEFKNFVGVYSIAPKVKPYMYDQGIQVNKKDIDLTLELQQEENQSGFVPSKEEEKKDEEDDLFDERKKEKKIHHFSEDEIEKVFSRPNFKRFIRKGSDIIEHQLSDTEPFVDDLIDRNDVGVQGEKSMLNYGFSFTHESVKGFSASGLVWSKTNSDLVLIVYQTTDRTEPFASKILIWSLKSKHKPIHILHSEKKVTRAIFHPRNESKIFAAAYSGNILEYNTKPDVQISVPSNKTCNIGDKDEYHSVPIYVLEMFFRENAEYLVSIAVDGRMCIWNTNTFETIMNKILENKPQSNTSGGIPCIHPLASTVLYPGTDEATLVLGTYDASLNQYKLVNFLSDENLEETLFSNVATGHLAPIVSLAAKEDPQRDYLNGLVLTTSFDFDVQLWRLGDGFNSLISKFSIHSDYVHSAEWNPINPAIFATCDCNGRFLVFDLTANSHYFTYEATSIPCSAMRWSPDGLKLIFAGLNGESQIWVMRKKYIKFEESAIEKLRRELA